MANTTDKLSADRFIADIDARLKELAPAGQEIAHLSELRETLSGVKKGGPSRKTRSRTASRRGSNRRGEFIKIVKDNPGITVSAAASQMDINQPNYLYRVAGKAVEDGVLARDGKGYSFVSNGETAPAKVESPDTTEAPAEDETAREAQAV